MEYRDDTNYCGPSGRKISTIVRRKILDVDTNHDCYNHDIDYLRQIPRKEADVAWRDRMYDRIRRRYKWHDPRQTVAIMIARRRYWIVRAFGGAAYRRAGKEQETTDDDAR